MTCIAVPNLVWLRARFLAVLFLVNGNLPGNDYVEIMGILAFDYNERLRCHFLELHTESKMARPQREGKSVSTNICCKKALRKFEGPTVPAWLHIRLFAQNPEVAGRRATV